LGYARTPPAIRKGFLFRAENFFNYAASLDDITLTDPGILQYYGGASLHQQYHGQGFLSFFEHRCRMEGLYLLDEPESALSPSNQLALVEILCRLGRCEGFQFIVSTHSPILLACPGAQILSFDESPVSEVSYEETASYRFYKAFLDQPGQFLDPICRKPGTQEGGNG
jgi:predicted ATPase